MDTATRKGRPPLPEPLDGRIPVYFTSAEAAEIRARARADDRTPSHWVARVVRQQLALMPGVPGRLDDGGAQ